MIVSDAVRQLQNLLNESDSDGWMDTQTTYDYLYEAVVEFISRTKCVTATQSITTTANEPDYDLNSDFLQLYMRNSSGEHYIKYTDGNITTFPTWKDYADVIYENDTTAIEFPTNFTITPGDPYQLKLVPPPATAGHTVTVYYVQAPTKVTTSSGTYPIPDRFTSTIVKYAFWLYKYRDSEPNFADAMYRHWDVQVSRFAQNINKSIRVNNFKVNFKRRM